MKAEGVNMFWFLEKRDDKSAEKIMQINVV